MLPPKSPISVPRLTGYGRSVTPLRRARRVCVFSYRFFWETSWGLCSEAMERWENALDHFMHGSALLPPGTPLLKTALEGARRARANRDIDRQVRQNGWTGDGEGGVQESWRGRLKLELRRYRYSSNICFEHSCGRTEMSCVMSSAFAQMLISRRLLSTKFCCVVPFVDINPWREQRGR